MNYSLIWWVLLLPVIGFLVQAFTGKTIVNAFGPAAGKRVMGALAVLPIAIAFAIGAWITYQMTQAPAEARSAVAHGFEWINVLGLRLPFELIVDPLSMLMVLIITGVGALIHLYATGYMAEEKDYPRFFTYLNLFIAAMLILVLGNNLALLFIGWEGVGLCSYLLIGFWYKDIANAKAANKAFIVNRIGDWGLTLGLFLIVVLLASSPATAVPDGRYLSYDVILPALRNALEANPGMATAIGLLLFVGAAGKSAQFPLYLWLPDAMAGPTPVSALIHAATMVTSGVVLLNRMHIVFEFSPVASVVVACIGAFTALFAALVAFGQTDIKKVLAYSTVSQLGFMFIGCGVGVFWSGMFHVTTHAFFKALLFLGSGAVIAAMAHNQDMRNYGNLFKYLKITGITMIIGWLAIAGIPPLAGFWSKEAILGGALANHHAEISGIQVGQFMGWVGLFVAALTAMYMTRMTWLTFFGGEERWRGIPAHGHDHAHDLEDTHEAHAVAIEHNPVAEVGDDHHGPDEHGFFFTHEEMHALPHEHEHHHDLDKNHEPKEVFPSMWIPLVVLAIASLFGGWMLAGPWSLEHWLYPNGLPILGEMHTHPEEGLAANLLWLSIGAAVLGIVAGLAVYAKGLPKKEGWDESKWNPFRRWAGAQFGYDSAMVTASVDGGADLAKVAWRNVDAGLIDGIVNGFAWVSGKIGDGVRVLQTGYIRMYALMMLLGGVGILAWFLYLINRTGGTH